MQENGKLRWPVFTGLPAPRWRHPGWEDLDPLDRIDVFQALNEALDFFPQVVDDAELWGSRAFGCADEMSDFDFNVVTPPLPAGYREAEWWWDFTNKLNEVSHRLGVRIEAAPTAPSQRESNVVFSLRDYRFYGKAWGEKLRERRRWDPDMNSWASAPLRHLTHARVEDPWPSR